jgi:hypothetical protein
MLTDKYAVGEVLLRDFFSSHCTLRFGEKHRNYHVIVKSRWEMPITAIGRPVADAA